MSLSEKAWAEREARGRREKRDQQKARLERRKKALQATEAPSYRAFMEQADALLGILEKEKDGHRASRAAGAMLTGFDRCLAAHPSELELDCARGCAFCCCGVYVTCSAPELFHLAAVVKRWSGARREALLERVRLTQAETGGQTPLERQAGRVHCPFLENWECSAYAARPLVCRAAVSTDVDRCEANYLGELQDLTVPAMHGLLKDLYSSALGLAATAAGLRNDGYELVAGLLKVLETPDAEARWLAGEDVLGEARCLPVAYADPYQGLEREDARQMLDAFSVSSLEGASSREGEGETGLLVTPDRFFSI